MHRQTKQEAAQLFAYLPMSEISKSVVRPEHVEGIKFRVVAV